MKVKEFYDWCKSVNLEDAVMGMVDSTSSKIIDIEDKNIDYGIRLMPEEEAGKYVRFEV